MAALWHRTPTQLVGRPLLQVLPELDTPDLQDLLAEVVRTGTPYVAQEWEAPLMGRTGEPRYFNFVYQPLRDPHGLVEAVACVAAEVTDQVRARRASDDQAHQLQLLTDALPALVARVDAQERYVFANQAYEAWYGLCAADLVGRPVREVMGEEAFVRGQENRARAQAGESVAFEATMAFRPDWVRHVHGTLVPAVQHGQPAGYYILIFDVTDLVNARQAAEASAERAYALADELNRANQQLSRTNVDLDNFVYMTSHDLQAPITNVAGLLSILREELPAAVAEANAVPRVLTMMQGAVERLQLTLRQMAEVARLQRGPEQAPEAVDLPDLVQGIRLDLAPLLAEAQAQLDVDVTSCPKLRFTPAHLRSIVYNLLSNAVKYRHPDRPPRIQLRAHCQETQAVLEVEDNGLGLDEQQQAQLFRMFGRLHAHVEGSGVGLHMIKRMVENAGGTIGVESQPGRGSTFRVTLPL